MTVCGGIFTCSGIDLFLFILWFIALLIFGLLFVAKKISSKIFKWLLISGMLIIPISLGIEYMLWKDYDPTRINDRTAWAMGCSTAISRYCNITDFESGSATSGLYIARYDPLKNDPKTNGFTLCNQEKLGEAGCSDDTLFMACSRTQGLNEAVACRKKCCGP